MTTMCLSVELVYTLNHMMEHIHGLIIFTSSNFHNWFNMQRLTIIFNHWKNSARNNLKILFLNKKRHILIINQTKTNIFELTIKLLQYLIDDLVNVQQLTSQMRCRINKYFWIQNLKWDFLLIPVGVDPNTFHKRVVIYNLKQKNPVPWKAYNVDVVKDVLQFTSAIPDWFNSYQEYI